MKDFITAKERMDIIRGDLKVSYSIPDIESGTIVYDSRTFKVMKYNDARKKWEPAYDTP